MGILSLFVTINSPSTTKLATFTYLGEITTRGIRLYLLSISVIVLGSSISTKSLMINILSIIAIILFVFLIVISGIISVDILLV